MDEDLRAGIDGRGVTMSKCKEIMLLTYRAVRTPDDEARNRYIGACLQNEISDRLS